MSKYFFTWGELRILLPCWLLIAGYLFCFYIGVVALAEMDKNLHPKKFEKCVASCENSVHNRKHERHRAKLARARNSCRDESAPATTGP